MLFADIAKSILLLLEYERIVVKVNQSISSHGGQFSCHGTAVTLKKAGHLCAIQGNGDISIVLFLGLE